MHRLSIVGLVTAGLFALACGDPLPAEKPARPGASSDVATPPPPPDADRPPPGGWIADGVIYDKDGSVYGCVGGGNACAGPPAGTTDEVEQELDLCGDVDAIRDAVLDRHDRTGTYVAVRPTPRPVAQLDERSVAWPAKSGFAELGWAPGGSTRATFWVDTTRDGFEVHGLALVREGTWLHCFATAEQGAVDTPWRGR